MRGLAAFAASFGGPFPIVGEVCRPVAGLRPFGFAPVTASVACLAAFAAGIRGTLAIAGEVAGTILAADMTRPGRLLAVFSEISRIARMPFLCHVLPLADCVEVPVRCTRLSWNGATRVWLSSNMP